MIIIVNIKKIDHLKHQVEINVMFVEVFYKFLISIKNIFFLKKRLWSLGCQLFKRVLHIIRNLFL